MTNSRAVSGRWVRRKFAFPLLGQSGYRGVIGGEGGAGEMLATKERIQGHYEVTKTPWATDYVWVPQEEEVERRLLEEVLHPWHASYVEWIKEERAYPELQEWLELEEI